MTGSLSGRYCIRAVTPADLPLLHEWRGREHVRRWWGDPSKEPEEEKLREGRVGMWIAENAGTAFAFLQDYRVSDWSPHHFDGLPEGARGLDLYIGEESHIGQGHGAAVLTQHAAALFGAGAPALGIDPHPDNGAAIRAFEKAGFRQRSGPVVTAWGGAILMDRFAPTSMRSPADLEG